jgi:hypothetical protein
MIFGKSNEKYKNGNDNAVIINNTIWSRLLYRHINLKTVFSM